MAYTAPEPQTLVAKHHDRLYLRRPFAAKAAASQQQLLPSAEVRGLRITKLGAGLCWCQFVKILHASRAMQPSSTCFSIDLVLNRLKVIQMRGAAFLMVRHPCTHSKDVHLLLHPRFQWAYSRTNNANHMAAGRVSPLNACKGTRPIAGLGTPAT